MGESFNRSEIEMRLKDKIGVLCNAHGVTGYEDDVIGIVRKEIKDFAQEIKTDALGNLISKVNGNGKKKIMIAAHTDEIGLIIRKIDKDGFLWFETIGGLRPQVLFSRSVIIKTEKGFVNGIANHVKPGRPEGISELPEVEEFFIDVGAKTKEEIEEMGIEVGNTVSINYEMMFLGKNRIAGKAMDDRICIFILLELARLLSGDSDIPDLYFVFTSQEEVGGRGAKAAAYEIKPDIAIALDLAIANDFPGNQENRIMAELDKGPVIKVMDLIRGAMMGIISSKEVVKGLKHAAIRAGLKYQIEVSTAGTTDAATMHIERGGIKSGSVCVPSRYVHAYEVISINDTIDCIKLVYEYIKGSAH